MKLASREGFTLIELLVVISIIGLLSSVVLASLNATREKSRIAGARQFSATIHHAVGDQALSIFDFSEGSGGLTKDMTGQNTMSLNAPLPWVPADLAGEVHALTFNGSTDYAYTQPTTMNGTNETMGVWVKTSSANGLMLLGQGYKRRLFNNHWVFVDSINGYTDFTLPYPVNDGKWHHMAYSLSGTSLKMYTDGKLVGSATLSALMNPWTESWQIGGNMCSGASCNVFVNASYAGLNIYNGSIF